MKKRLYLVVLNLGQLQQYIETRNFNNNNGSKMIQQPDSAQPSAHNETAVAKDENLTQSRDDEQHNKETAPPGCDNAGQEK